MHHTPRLTLIICLVLAAAARADVKLPAIFGDNMVLQRGQPVTIWGWAEPGEKVSVSWTGNLTSNTRTSSEQENWSEDQSVTAGADGQWKVTLKAKKLAGGPIKLSVKGNNTITLENVLLGDVWLCSGQSNMAWTVSKSDGADQEIPAAKHPMIRLITVPRTPQEKPQNDFKGAWVECSPESIKEFSAVAYYFGRDLRENLNVPIGLINSSYGGTPAEAWTSRAALDAGKEFKPLLDHWDKQAAEMTAEKVQKQNQEALDRWKVAAEKAKKEGKAAPARPRPAAEPRLSQNRPANLYNGMIHPIAPLSIRGVIWYQGESNCPRAAQYRTLFPAMIENWRDAFDQKDLPFLFVQLAPFRYTRNPKEWCAELWEAQLHTLRTVPHTGMAVTTDLGNIGDIHPTNKQEVGRRLALWARGTVYGEKNLAFSGPILSSAKVEGGAMRLSFGHAQGLKARDGKPLTHFTIAGKDNVFHAAEAKIDGDAIVVTSEKVEKPVAVRFAWTDDAEPNLVNGAGLPASPFRTDDLPLLTAEKTH